MSGSDDVLINEVMQMATEEGTLLIGENGTLSLQETEPDVSQEVQEPQEAQEPKRKTRKKSSAGLHTRELAVTGSAFDYQGVHFQEQGLDLPQDLPFDAWSNIMGTLLKVERGIQWAIGDALNFGELAYGESYTQAVELTGLTFTHLSHLKWVAGVFPRAERLEALSFSHHAEVASIRRISPDTAREILNRAIEDNLSVKEVRHDAREARIDLGMEDGILPLRHDDEEDEDDADEVTAASGSSNSTSRAERGTGPIVAQAAWLDELLDITVQAAWSESPYISPADGAEAVHIRAQAFVTKHGLWGLVRGNDAKYQHLMRAQIENREEAENRMISAGEEPEQQGPTE